MKNINIEQIMTFSLLGRPIQDSLNKFDAPWKIKGLLLGV